jgi:methylamine dehydrogenase accessory protein MauD
MSTPLLVSYVLLWVVVALLAVVVLAAVRQIGLIQHRIPPVGARMTAVGPQIGSQAPGFNGPDLFGRPTTLGSPRGRKSLLVFVSTRCDTCDDLAPAIKSIARSESDMIDTILMSDSPEEDVRNYARRHSLTHLPIVVSQEVVESYAVQATPYGLLVDESQNVVSKGIVNNIEHLESLVRAGELSIDSMETLAETSENGGRRETGAAV